MDKADFRSYLGAVIDAPIGIIFALLDLAAMVGVFLWVVDDLNEVVVLLAFVLVTHLGHYLIFRKERFRVTALQSELGRIQAKQPVLAMEFLIDEHTTSHLKIKAGQSPPETDYPSLVEQERERLIALYEKAAKDYKPGPRLELFGHMDLLIEHLKSRDQFEGEIQEYLIEYNKHLVRKSEFEREMAHIRSVTFELSNSGTIPAHDIQAFLHFPGPFRFPSYEELLDIEMNSDAPVPPTPPDSMTVPLSKLGQALDAFNVSIPMPPLLLDRSTSPPNVRGPFIAPTESALVSYEIDKLLHGFSAELDKVHFFLTDELIGRAWQVKYEIHSSDLPRPMAGRLVLEVE
jgi:hypothetical protein